MVEKTIVVTHRIKKIHEDGSITTKGDNNRVADAIPITIDNIEAKVVLTCNWVADLIHTWDTTKGKLIICSLAAGVLLFLFGLQALLEKDEDKGKRKEGTKGDSKRRS